MKLRVCICALLVCAFIFSMVGSAEGCEAYSKEMEDDKLSVCVEEAAFDGRSFRIQLRLTAKDDTKAFYNRSIQELPEGISIEEVDPPFFIPAVIEQRSDGREIRNYRHVITFDDDRLTVSNEHAVEQEDGSILLNIEAEASEEITRDSVTVEFYVNYFVYDVLYRLEGIHFLVERTAQ